MNASNGHATPPQAPLQPRRGRGSARMPTFLPALLAALLLVPPGTDALCPSAAGELARWVKISWRGGASCPSFGWVQHPSWGPCVPCVC
jgi:hypothetical protein